MLTRLQYQENCEEIWTALLQLRGLCELLDTHESDDEDSIKKEHLHALLSPIAEKLSDAYVAFNDNPPAEKESAGAA